jgi:transcriptional regulator with XRE-family HTH domain
METSEGIKIFRDRERFNTQTDLAKTLEIKPGNVSLWEAGSGYPSFLVAKKLFELGITVEELFGIEYAKKHNLIKDKDSKEDELDLMLKDWKKIESRIEALEALNDFDNKRFKINRKIRKF